jgi:predicted AlkP superfamily pyrophosphatase or phosphodiesterase
MIGRGDASAVLSSLHGSPWSYDTYVPVLFAGAGLKPQQVSREITPYDIAPTLAAYLGTKPPSAAVGSPLAEVLGD